MPLDKRAILLTIGVYVLLLLWFIFGAFRTPLPLPGEEGITINFGFEETGSGSYEPKVNKEIVINNPPPKITKTETKTEEILTQDVEDAPSLETETKEVVKEEKKEEIVEKEEVKEEIKEEPKVVNPMALYKGRNTESTQSNSEGDAGGKGNQGDPEGDVNSNSRLPGLGSGNGPSFNLSGRNPVSLPSPKVDLQKEGKVVVEVTVDRDGKVIKAVAGVKGSTTLDSQLLSIAKQSALASRFDSKTDAPTYQIGTITYIFSLR